MLVARFEHVTVVVTATCVMMFVLVQARTSPRPVKDDDVGTLPPILRTKEACHSSWASNQSTEASRARCDSRDTLDGRRRYAGRVCGRGDAGRVSLTEARGPKCESPLHLLALQAYHKTQRLRSLQGLPLALLMPGSLKVALDIHGINRIISCQFSCCANQLTDDARKYWAK